MWPRQSRAHNVIFNSIKLGRAPSLPRKGNYSLLGKKINNTVGFFGLLSFALTNYVKPGAPIWQRELKKWSIWNPPFCPLVLLWSTRLNKDFLEGNNKCPLKQWYYSPSISLSDSQLGYASYITERKLDLAVSVEQCLGHMDRELPIEKFCYQKQL